VPGQSGFARSIGPDQGHELPLLDGQIHAAQGHDLAPAPPLSSRVRGDERGVDVFEVLDLDEWTHWTSVSHAGDLGSPGSSQSSHYGDGDNDG